MKHRVRRRSRRSKPLKQIPMKILPFFELVKDIVRDRVDPEIFDNPFLEVYHFSTPITSATYYNIEDDKIFTGNFILNDPEDPDQCFCILPDIQVLETFPKDFQETNEKMNEILNLVDVFMPLLRIMTITDNDGKANYNEGCESNNCQIARNDYCCGFMSNVSCVLAALNDYNDFRIIEDNPIKTFKRVANIISSFTPYHKCIKDCPIKFDYSEEFDRDNGVSLGTLYVDDGDITDTLHHFCVYKFNNWVIIIDSWSDVNGARPLWGRIVSIKLFDKFIRHMNQQPEKRDIEFLEMFLDRFFIIPGSLSKFESESEESDPGLVHENPRNNSGSETPEYLELPVDILQLGFKNFREEDFLKRYPLTFAGSRKKRSLKLNRVNEKSKSNINQT